MDAVTTNADGIAKVAPQLGWISKGAKPPRTASETFIFFAPLREKSHLSHAPSPVRPGASPA
jgi:hypothetical protein